MLTPVGVKGSRETHRTLERKFLSSRRHTRTLTLMFPRPMNLDGHIWEASVTGGQACDTCFGLHPRNGSLAAWRPETATHQRWSELRVVEVKQGGEGIRVW